MILLILTDGIVNDLQETVDAIIKAGNLPLSIIIVGIGDADFAEMDMLDADHKPLYSEKLEKHMDNDIVQFVPYYTFKDDPRELARRTLEEIPMQFINYMERNSITPGN